MRAVFVALFASVVACAGVQPAVAADAAGWKESVLHAFNFADGSQPVAGLINVNGTLYGTTSLGGAYGSRDSGGTVFSLDAGTGAETVLWALGQRHIHPPSPSEPMAGVIDVKGKLYGTTIYGGCRGCAGTVFSLDPATDTHKVLYGFPCRSGSCPDGAQPFAGLISLNGFLYGTTTYGGHGVGTVFSVDPKTGAETVLYAFAGGSDGAEPQGGLIDVNGMLYGTTSGGGGGDDGTVFSIDPATGTETVVHAFDKTDGLGPSGLIDVSGTLYGIAGFGGNTNTGCYGGSLGCGTVFSLDPATGAITVLYAFSGQDGSQPDGLVEVNGMLYGTTFWGGAGSGDGGGTAFSLDPSTGAEKVLHSFLGGGSDGLYPEPGLINVSGKLYGTTYYGGGSDNGTVFVLQKTK